MVIQRWQSVLLLLATIFMAVSATLPFAEVALDSAKPDVLTEIFPKQHTVYLILNVTIAVLLFVAIFLFKNLRRQRMVSKIAIMLIVVSAVAGVLLSYTNYGVACLHPSCIVAHAGALFTSVWAYIRIGKDQKLLSSADRLR